MGPEESAHSINPLEILRTETSLQWQTKPRIARTALLATVELLQGRTFIDPVQFVHEVTGVESQMVQIARTTLVRDQHIITDPERGHWVVNPEHIEQVELAASALIPRLDRNPLERERLAEVIDLKVAADEANFAVRDGIRNL